VQVIRKAGYQVKEQKAEDKQEGNIEYRTKNIELLRAGGDGRLQKQDRRQKTEGRGQN
jgi:hypothetical protein